MSQKLILILYQIIMKDLKEKLMMLIQLEIMAITALSNNLKYLKRGK